MSELGAGPLQTQSSIGVCEDGQLSPRPPQSKKQKPEAQLCGGSICASSVATSGVPSQGSQNQTACQCESGGARCGCGDRANEDTSLAVSDRMAASLGDLHAVTASAQPAETGRGLDETAAASSSSTPTASGCVTLEYTDVFLGRKMCILFRQRSQIEAPLKLIKSLSLLFLRSSGPARSFEHRQPPLFPFESMHINFWQVQRVRAIFGVTAQACRRLAMTLPSLNVPRLNVAERMTWRWRTRMIVRVLSGFCGKLQVRRRVCASICAFHPCSWSHKVLY
jgi:hypothetical protein